MNKKILSPNFRILKGYAALLKTLGIALAFLAFAVAVSVAITYPLWLWASISARTYTAALLILALTLILAFLALRIYRAYKTQGSPVAFLRKLILPLAVRILFILVSLAGLYGILLLYFRKIFVAAIAATFFYIYLIGFLLYARKSFKLRNHHR